MRYQNFKSDFAAVHKFYTTDGSTQTQIAVPQHVRLTYFTAERRGCIVVERNGAILDGCTVSEDGMTLTAAIALSKTLLGTGELICEIEEFSDNSEFPDGIRKDVTPVKMGVTLWPGKTDDDSSVESDIVIGYLSDAATAANNAATAANEAADNANKAAQECKADTEQNTKDIATNKTAIAKNATDIASNTAAISSEATARAAADATLTQQIADNTEDIDTNATAIDAINALVARLNRDFGRYNNPTSVTLTQSISGKYVHKDTAKEVSASGYGISTPIALKKGDLLLVPSASAVVAECSVVSRQVTNPYDRVILYAYTYDASGRIATATADYDTSLVYTAHYADDETMAVDYWTIGSEQVNTLPSTYAVTESFYVPLVQQSVAAMPSEGYYIYLASEAMDVVISGFTATVNGGVAILAGWGVLKNIASNFVGIDGQQVLAEALNNLAQRVAGIEAKIAGGFSELTVGKLHIGRGIDGLNIDTNFNLEGEGAPSADVVPEGWKANWFAKYGDWRGIPLFKGQWYYDTKNKNLYRAKGTDSVSDWQLIK